VPGCRVASPHGVSNVGEPPVWGQDAWPEPLLLRRKQSSVNLLRSRLREATPEYGCDVPDGGSPTTTRPSKEAECHLSEEDAVKGRS
jgi:hypothetical protein